MLKEKVSFSGFSCLFPSRFIMTTDIPFSLELHQRTKDVHDASDKLINVKLLIALTDINVYGSVLKVENLC